MGKPTRPQATIFTRRRYHHYITDNCILEAKHPILRRNFRQILFVALTTFTLTLMASWGSRLMLRAVTLLPGLLLLVFIILTGILFDMIGTAVTAAHEAPFHAMAANKLPGATLAIKMVRHADRVANFCNDVVGDIAGTLSGAVGAALVAEVSQVFPRLPLELVTVVTIALVSTLTVTGKAMGKGLAIREAHAIIFLAARLLAWVERTFHLPVLPRSWGNPRLPPRERKEVASPPRGNGRKKERKGRGSGKHPGANRGTD